MPLPITDATTEFVALAEVKRHLNIPDADTTQDEELDLCKGAAQDHVESLIGPVLHRTVTQVARSSGSVVLNVLPVLSVTGIDAGGTAVTGWSLDAGSGIVSSAYFSGTSTVTYQAGRDSCPDAVRMATLIIAKHLWDTQRGNAPSALPENDTPEFSAEFQAGFAVPRRAAELLAPYMLTPGFA